MKRIAMMSLAAVLFVTGSVGTQAFAQTDMSKFPLARAIPDDAFIAVAAKQNPDRKFLDAYWAEVSQAFFNSGFLDELWDLIGDTMPANQLDVMEELREQFSDLAAQVDWGQLLEKEMIYAGRFAQLGEPGIIYEGILIGRLDKKSAKTNYKALKGLLEEICKFAVAKTGEEGLAVTESKSHGAKVATLAHADAPGVGVKLAVRGDLIFLCFGATAIFDDALDLLQDDAKGKRLIESTRFKAAIEQLPPAEDVITFFDAEGMFGTFRGFASSIGAAAKLHQDKQGPGGEADESAVVFKAIDTLLADISIIDSVASVEWTDGYRVYSDTITTVRKGGKTSPLYKIITSGKPLKHFETFIPKEADSFSVCAGIDLAGVYDYLTGFVEENAPDGADMIATFDEMQAEWGIDIKKDVLELFTGASVGIKIGKNWAILLDVTNEKKVEAQIDRLLTTVNNMLGQENALMISSVDVGAKAEFRQISHPMMMIVGGMSPPVLGCTNGHFVLGSSARIVRKCIQTAAGKHPNITESERWLAEALAPEGKVTSVSFTDETHTAQELQEAIAGLSMGLGMVGMFAMDAPPEMRKIFSALPPLLNKLSPVAAKMNFYKSSASYSSFDGRRWYSRQVQNYKKPNERPKPVADKEETREVRVR